MSKTPDLALEVIQDAWGWTGLRVEALLARNAFGNLILRDQDDQLWRIMPEELSCAPMGVPVIPWGLASFQQDWEMERLVVRAQTALGPLAPQEAYGLQTPSPLGGLYRTANMQIVPLETLHRVAGAIAAQIDDVPDGSDVNLVILRG